VLTIEIADFPAEGVTLTPATAPDFDERAQAILNGRADPVLELKPLLAIVQNRNPRTVVAYAVSFTRTLRNGMSAVDYAQFKFPDAVAGTSRGLSVLKDREIRTGDERLIGLGFEVWPPDYAASFRDYGIDAVMRLGEVQVLEIGLDAVIFEDGVMMGKDQSHLAENFIEYILAKQSLYRDIVVGLESGSFKDDVFAPMRDILAVRPAARESSIVRYRRQAASDVLHFRDRVLLEIFRRTLRNEPFAIRRPSETSD
jgi:hypothetical protein